MSDIKSTKFTLTEACIPPLKAGRYNIKARQNITSPETDSFSADMEICVAYPHFSLNPNEVYSVYPQHNAVGNFSNTMPHIVLNKKTLPWEREISCESGNTPWMAVVCTTQDEAQCKSISIRDLLATNKDTTDTFYPLKPGLDMPVEKSENPCKVLDISTSLFESIFPKEEELRYLAHVKNEDLYDKDDQIIEKDGYFSIVTANRFTPSDMSEALKSTLHLVSLEGFSGYLPGGANITELKKRKFVRVVSLHSWDVFSKSTGEAGFREIITNISADSLTVPTSSDSPAVFRRGYVPLEHISRTGETTVSLYRSALTPYAVTCLNNPATFTADGEIIYDEHLGIFDMSYSAAWQLGRLLTIQNRSVATNIFNWRRNIDFQEKMESSKGLLREKLSSFTDKEDIMSYWVHELCHEITENELIAPVSMDRRG